MRRFLLRSLLNVFFMAFITSSLIPLVGNANQNHSSTSIQRKLAELEASVNGRLGLSAINTANDTRIEYRGKERFPFCSTAKVMVVAAVLKASEKDHGLLTRKITYSQADVDKSGYAPITQQNLANGMSVNDLCQAAIEYSDNTAMNLLIKILGGPETVTQYAHSIHNSTFRLDRGEPELNTAIPDDYRDTTTPNAMVNSLKKLILGNLLALPHRELLDTWLKNNTTGNSRIRAGVPKSWVVGDKTGTGSYGTTNDIAIIRPYQCRPIVIAVYLTLREKNAVKHDEVIASATRLVIDEISKNDRCVEDSISKDSKI